MPRHEVRGARGAVPAGPVNRRDFARPARRARKGAAGCLHSIPSFFSIFWHATCETRADSAAVGFGSLGAGGVRRTPSSEVRIDGPEKTNGRISQVICRKPEARQLALVHYYTRYPTAR